MSQTTPATTLKLLLTALFWGGTWVAGRVAVQEAAPFAVASWRFLIAAVVLGILLIRREGWPLWSPQHWLKMIALGLSGVFFYNVFFLYGLQRVEAGRGALVVAFIPAMIAIVDWLLFRLPMSPQKALGIVLSLLGCLLVVTRGQPMQLLAGEVGLGEWLLLGSAVSWVSYTLVSRHCSRQFSALALTFGGCFTGWLMLTAAALADGSLFALQAMSWRGGSGIVFLGLFGTAIAFTWYSEGIARIGTTKAAAFINLVPVFAVLLGTLLLDEWVGIPVLAGGALVMVGVFLTNKRVAESTPLNGS
jgi:drug/metabolite transporter (DMT)-like permease